MASWFSGKLSPFMKGNRSYWRYTHVPLNHDVMGGRINRWLLERRWSKNPSNILKFTSKVGPKIPPQQSMKPTENDPNKNTNWYGNPRFLHFLVVGYNPSFGGVFIPFLFPWGFWGSKGGKWSTCWTLKRHQAFQATEMDDDYDDWSIYESGKTMGLFVGVMEDSLRYPHWLSAKQRSWQSSH